MRLRIDRRGGPLQHRIPYKPASAASAGSGRSRTGPARWRPDIWSASSLSTCCRNRATSSIASTSVRLAASRSSAKLSGSKMSPCRASTRCWRRASCKLLAFGGFVRERLVVRRDQAQVMRHLVADQVVLRAFAGAAANRDCPPCSACKRRPAFPRLPAPAGRRRWPAAG